MEVRLGQCGLRIVMKSIPHANAVTVKWQSTFRRTSVVTYERAMIGFGALIGGGIANHTNGLRHGHRICEHCASSNKDSDCEAHDEVPE